MAILAVSTMALACGGDDGGAPTVFEPIDRPSAISHVLHDDDVDVVRSLVGAEREDGGLTFTLPGTSITGDDFEDGFFSLELHYSTPLIGMPPILLNSITTTLQFTLPASPFDQPAIVEWFVTPHMSCSHDLRSNLLVPSYEAGHPADYGGSLNLWYVVAVDPIGTHDLGAPGGIEATDPVIAAAPGEWARPSITGYGSGAFVDADNDFSGTFQVLPGAEAKIFLRSVFDIRGVNGGDVVELGVREPGSAPDYCRFSFDKKSYFTMRPVTP